MLAIIIKNVTNSDTTYLPQLLAILIKNVTNSDTTYLPQLLAILIKNVTNSDTTHLPQFYIKFCESRTWIDNHKSMHYSFNVSDNDNLCTIFVCTKYILLLSKGIFKLVKLVLRCFSQCS